MKDGSSYQCSISARQAAWYNDVKPEEKEDVSLQIAVTMLQEQILVASLNQAPDFYLAARIKSVAALKQHDGSFASRITLTDGYNIPTILMMADESNRFRRQTPDNQRPKDRPQPL